MVAVVTADPLGVLVAFGAGILSFISPCVLPLVPGYLSMVSGLSAAELGSARRSRGAGAPRTSGAPTARVLAAAAVLAPVGAGAGARVGAGAGAGAGALEESGGGAERAAPAGGRVEFSGSRSRRTLGPLLRGIVLFIGGFTVVFVALGAAASGLHPVLESHKGVLTNVSGALMVFLGAVMLAGALPAGVWARLGSSVSSRAAWVAGERRFHVRPQSLGGWAAPVMGMAFAFAWTPCIGPVLGAILALASFKSTLGGGVLLLFAYSLGLGVPFLVTGVAFDRLTTFYARARRGLGWVQVVAGVVLVAFGVVLLAGDLGWLSAQFRNLLDDVGLERLTTS